MESRQVIKLEVRSRPQPDPGSHDTVIPDGDPIACPAGPTESSVEALDHRELDAMLLREARRASDALLKASAALHAASSVVLEAVAALREERDRR